MKFTETALPGVYIVEPAVFGDNRGFFMESWSQRAFEETGLHYDFVQDNHSSSTVKGTLRGIHFQRGEKAQAKLVRCTKGAVLDVAVDLRPSSPHYKEWVAVELSAENKKQFYIPEGFAHGFLVLSDEAEFAYKCTDFYHPGDEGGLAYDDPEIGIRWPIAEDMDLIISEKDQKWGGLRETFQFHNV